MTSIRLAPMAGITDWPFRVLCFEQGCDVATTEMVSAMGYLYAPRNHPATVSLIERRDSEGKLLVQIFGKEADLMARAAEELSAMGRFDGVDVNMGCPAHKVAASGEGSGLMRTPENAEKILRAVCKASHLPVSVKMRLGWGENGGGLRRVRNCRTRSNADAAVQRSRRLDVCAQGKGSRACAGDWQR